MLAMPVAIDQALHIFEPITPQLLKNSKEHGRIAASYHVVDGEARLDREGHGSDSVAKYEGGKIDDTIE